MPPDATEKPQSKKLLIAGLVCLLIGSGWFVYEWLRPLTKDEMESLKEDQKIQAAIDKANKPH